MDGGDVRMVESGQQLGLGLETRGALRIRAEVFRQDLNRDLGSSEESLARYTSPMPPAD
jgi:hypothetical protein